MKYRCALATALLLASAVGCCPGSDAHRKIIQNKGSDTLVNVAQAWAEEYKIVNPSIAIAVSGGGSGTGISALTNGTVDIANSSRKITDKEQAGARSKGMNPKPHVVGHDALAVFVHRDNPIDGFTMAQLAEVFGEGGTITRWSELGVKVPGCGSDKIIRISRQNNSGTYEYFQKAVLPHRDFKFGSLDMHGSKDVADLVGNTPCAIGYSGLAYATKAIKMPCISKLQGDACVAPSVDSAIDGSYPISRPLFMYTPGEPEGDVKTYLDWVLSDVGQCIIVKKGYASARKIDCK